MSGQVEDAPRSESGIVWYEAPDAQVAIPGVNGSVLLDDLRRILSREWHKASYVGDFVILHSDGRVELREEGFRLPLPSGSRFVRNKHDHVHCLASFCGVAMWRSSDPETALGWIGESTNSWLCRTCHDCIMRHLDELARGLRDRGLLAR